MKRLTGLLLPLFLILFSCGAQESIGSKATEAPYDAIGGYYESEGSNYQKDGYMMADISTWDSSKPYYEEKEEEFSFNSAAVGKKFIYIVDTNRNSLVRIDAKTLKISTIEVGVTPEIVKTFPGEDYAMVLNSGSSTVTLVNDTGNKTKVKHFDIIKNANTLKLSKYGKYAAIYYSLKSGEQIKGELQAINIVDARPGKEKVIKIGVGFKPMDVVFSNDGKYLLAITEDGVTKVKLPDDIENPGFKPPVPFVNDPLLKEKGLEVQVTADGKYAITRVSGVDIFTILEIKEEKLHKINLHGMIPTDVDIVNGDNPKVILTFRDNHQIWIVDIKKYLGQVECQNSCDLASCESNCTEECKGDTLCKQNCIGSDECKNQCEEGDDQCIDTCEKACQTNCENSCIDQCPEKCEQECEQNCKVEGAVKKFDTSSHVLGLCQVAPNGKFALFYTTTTGKKYVGKLDLEGDNNEIQYILVRKTVKSIKIDDESKYAMIYHIKKSGKILPSDDENEQLEKTYGFSVMDVKSGFVAHYKTDSDPKDSLFMSDIEKMFVLVPDPSDVNHYVILFDFKTFQINEFKLQAKPMSVQRLPGTSKAVVLEQHISGRLTVFDAETGSYKSITGFQLNGEIE